MNKEFIKVSKQINYTQENRNELYNTYLDYEKINFLISALNHDLININIYPEVESKQTIIQFTSILFNWNNELINPNFIPIDIDILKTDSEKQLLATIILEWINNNTISFKEGMEPNCFKLSPNNHKKLVLTPNNPQ